jgi:8-oxo-dGTP diphosphatase
MYSYIHPHPAVSTDVVIFTIQDEQLRVLLIQRASEPYMNTWALPGGFVAIDEGLEQAALRELAEETGISGVDLEQLYTFGRPDRDPRERVITVAYYAMVSADRTTLRPASDAKDANWFPCASLPALAFDHDRIIAMALQRLTSKIEYSTIALQFMPSAFTLRELQRVYEIIQGESLDKRNFRKKILSGGIIADTGAQRRQGNHRPARLYSIKSPGKVEFIDKRQARDRVHEPH